MADRTGQGVLAGHYRNPRRWPELCGCPNSRQVNAHIIHDATIVGTGTNRRSPSFLRQPTGNIHDARTYILLAAHHSCRMVAGLQVSYELQSKCKRLVLLIKGSSLPETRDWPGWQMETWRCGIGEMMDRIYCPIGNEENWFDFNHPPGCVRSLRMYVLGLSAPCSTPFLVYRFSCAILGGREGNGIVSHPGPGMGIGAAKKGSRGRKSHSRWGRGSEGCERLDTSDACL